MGVRLHIHSIASTPLELYISFHWLQKLSSRIPEAEAGGMKSLEQQPNEAVGMKSLEKIAKILGGVNVSVPLPIFLAGLEKKNKNRAAASSSSSKFASP
ncbi:hypothetical protein MA16_Dca011338 [Dendrobium catenatum]|uniref:Uncharacterized protein n=1 Tax=Dendrobium catenatum TaxID=906689 RepID=A0A2I0WIU0_9ASPA|nr:hypothetical protein MA16_Dca011338 [Dendrobium catenatum]